MSVSGSLVSELQRLLKVVEADLRERSDDSEWEWSRGLKAEYALARERGRTALTWSAWRDGEVAQAAVAWVLGSVFVRFCEDNELLDGVWITGEGARGGLGLDAESAFYLELPSRNSRDWLRAGFGALADLPAGSGVLDRVHSHVWSAPLSTDGCTAILEFWRATNPDGSLKRSLSSAAWDTRFLGDIYQDLSESAKKKYALLQTPDFVEEFILDQTLEPALEEFGLEGLCLIDPACGSGHFLLGSFERLLTRWDSHAPGMDRRQRVQAALDHVHGVDVNPFAVAIARFRLTIAALRASGLTKLKDAPAFSYHLAVGDSLLAGNTGRQTDLLNDDADDDGLAGFAYSAEDVGEHPRILEPGRYHVVVANPPYITVKDKALNAAYREAYPTCKGKYALSVPFMELLFRLAKRGDATLPAGFVGQITSNSFMKREFGSKVIEGLLAGNEPTIPVDLTAVIDTSGAYIPGHGTPTVILIGRKQRGTGPVRAVLGVRGEPGQPADPAQGLVWTQIVDHLDDPGFDGDYVSVTDLDRDVLATFPWSLSGGGAAEVKSQIDDSGDQLLSSIADSLGITSFTLEDEVFVAPRQALVTHQIEDRWLRTMVLGDGLRDWLDSDSQPLAIFPYGADMRSISVETDRAVLRWMWPFRTNLSNNVMFGGVTKVQSGLRWSEYGRMTGSKLKTPLSIAFAFVATHNHFVLDRGGKVFNRSAPVIKLPAGATEDDHLALLGVLNSSTACFWLKQVSQNKGNGGIGGGIGDEAWEPRYEFTGTKLQEFPIPTDLPLDFGRRLDELARRLTKLGPASVCSDGVPTRNRLDAAHAEHDAVRGEMIAVQEELDWHTYGLFGPTSDDLTYKGDDLPKLALGERAFEIVLARRLADGSETTAWFTRHGATPITQIPAQWPPEYRDVVQRRIDLIAADRSIRLLERPEYKRRWAATPWDDMEHAALAEFCLDRLEEAALWSDGSRPRTLSVASLADQIRNDQELAGALRLWADNADIDVATALGSLVADQAVPFLAAYRHKEPGMVKRREWESVWDLQRREDAGETVDIPVPPKYAQADFRKPSYWKARGKLDVPKERFISYPNTAKGADSSLMLGWAGWDHAEQAQALAQLLIERSTEDGWDAARLTPLLAGLAELEPWLHQWHNEIDPSFGQSPAVMITGLVDQQLVQHHLTRADLTSWRP